MLTDKEIMRLGAERRLEQLDKERAAIKLRYFPAARTGKIERPTRVAQPKGMSPALRKATSIRMKKYWADRRKADKRVGS